MRESAPWVMLVVLALLSAWMGSRLLKAGRESSAARVAAPSRAAAERLADLIERVGNLEADVKGLRREWGDFEKSWEKRWGTVARGMRKDAVAAASFVPADSAEAEDAEITLPLFSTKQPPAAAPGRQRLVPASMLRRG